jgi:uncharacterized membrane protein HdeD (DUF308 family)
MRSKFTNYLQAVVLITGIVYIIIGLVMYVKPLVVLELFAENVSENWLDLVRDNELVAPLYYISRGFSALVFTSGLAMVMPLFDPLKYRGLIYYNGLVFPLLAGALYVYNGVFRIITHRQVVEETGKIISSEAAVRGIHGTVVILGIVFTIIFLLTAIGLVITRSQAHDGIE